MKASNWILRGSRMMWIQGSKSFVIHKQSWLSMVTQLVTIWRKQLLFHQGTLPKWPEGILNIHHITIYCQFQLKHGNTTYKVHVRQNVPNLRICDLSKNSWTRMTVMQIDRIFAGVDPGYNVGVVVSLSVVMRRCCTSRSLSNIISIKNIRHVFLSVCITLVTGSTPSLQKNKSNRFKAVDKISA